MAEQPRFFDIEDYETGKRYRVEAYADDVTYDEAVQHLSSLPEEEWAQYEYNPEPQQEQRAAPERTTTTDTTAPTPEPVEGKQPRRNVFIENSTGGTLRYTEALRERPDLVNIAESMWEANVRDPAKYNEALGTNVFTKDVIAQIRRIDAYYTAQGYSPRGRRFTAIEETGIPEPEAPDSVVGSLGQSAVKSGLQAGNTLYGLAGVAADLVGADETAEDLFEKYVQRAAATEYYNPDAVGTLQNVQLDNFAQYAAEAVGQLLPDLATGGVAAFAGKKAGELIAKKAVADFVEDRVQEGVPREIAENLATQAITKKVVNRSITGSVTAQSIAQETGAIAGDTFMQTGETAPLSSIAAGVLSGSLDAILPVRFLNNMGINGDVVRQAFGRQVGKAITEGAKGFAIEGATEALQTFIAELPTSYITGESPFTEEMLSRMADAFVKGGIGGSTVQAASAAVTGDYRGPLPIVTPEGEATIVAPEGRRNSKKYKQALTTATARGQEITDEIVSGWENKPNVRVVDNFQNERFDNDALGVYEGDGNIALNMEAIVAEAKARNVSPDTVVESVLFHEALGHYGLESLYRDNLDAKLTQFYAEGSEDFVRMVDTWIEQNPGAYTDPATGEVNIARAAEEVLAEMSEAGNIPRSMIDELLNMIKDFMRNMGLDNTKLFRDALKYSERELRTIVAMGQAKVRDGEQVDLDTGTPSDKYMYIGTVGASNIDNRTALRLDDVLEREQLGIYSEEDLAPSGRSRQDYGWFKAPDGAWRYEINDSDAIIDLEMTKFENSMFGNSRMLPLDQVLDHPQLFEAYPELRIYSVTRDPELFDPKELSQGWFDPNTRIINITPYSRNPESTLIHEVQHAVQDIEGFAPGGNPEQAIQDMPEDLLLTGADRLVQHLRQESRRADRKIQGIKEMGRMPEFQKWARTRSDDDFASLATKLGMPQDWNNWEYKDQVEFSRAVPFLYTDGTLTPDGIEAESRASALEDRYEALAEALRDGDIGRIREEAAKDEQAAFSAYEHIFGEVEARDTQERFEFGYDQDARRDMEPYTSSIENEDINPEEYVFPRQGGVSSSVKYAKPKKFEDNRRFAPPSRFESLEEAINNWEAAEDFYHKVQRDLDDKPEWSSADWARSDAAWDAMQRAAVEYYRSIPGPLNFVQDEEYRRSLFGIGNVTPEEQAEINQLINFGAFNDNESLNSGGIEIDPTTEEGQAQFEELLKPSRNPSDVSILRPTVKFGLNPPEANDKYARPMRQNKNVEPLTIDELTAEDLFNSLNAYDIVKRVADNYVPTSMSLDDLQSEALLRDVPVSAVQKLSVNPGDFTVKLFQYDMVARKLNDKVATLAEKINSGRYTAKDKSDFLKASFAFEDVTSKIFGLQSEYGRALRALQEMEFTNKRVRTLRDALKGLTGEAASLQGLDDPATFEKFARSMAKRIQIKSAPAESSLGDKFASAINTPRAIMSSYDLSAPLRQGVFFIGRKEYYTAWKSMFSGVRSEQNYTDMMKDVMRTEYYPLMSVGKLFISSLDGDLASREEAFQSSFARNVPGVRRSEVAYAAFLNKLRTDLFANYIKTFEDAGYEFTTKVDPQTGERIPKPVDELSEKEIAILKGLGSFINAGTGRGNLTIGDKNTKMSRMIQAAGPLLNALLFSPGLIASRIRLLNPVWYTTLPAPVRKEAIKEAGKFFPGLAMTLGLINLVSQAMGEDEEEKELLDVVTGAFNPNNPGAVEWDPRSSNFLKVNIDGTRYDITGGMAQYMTLFTKGFVHSSNLLAGTEWASKKTSTGGLVRYEDDFRGRTFFDDIVRFGRYKLSPMASLFADFADGKNAVGEPFTVAGAVGDRMMPLYVQDLLEISEEEGGLSVGALLGAMPGFFGVGVSRYTPQSLDTEQELSAPDGWDDKELPDAENSFVIVRDGKVILKDNAARMYKKTVNAFFQEIIQEQVAHPLWPELTPKEQAEIIEQAKRIARSETKRYISPLIGIVDAPEEEFEEQ